jgi:hypothetical protein
MTKKTYFKVGDSIYIENDLNFDDQIIGGRAKISEINYKTKEIKLKGFHPAYSFDLLDLIEKQAELKKHYGLFRWFKRARLLQDAGVDSM